MPNQFAFEFGHFNFLSYFANFYDVTPYEKYEKLTKILFVQINSKAIGFFC